MSYNDIAHQDRLNDNTFIRHNIGLLCEYQSQNLGCKILAVNTHLYWNPLKPEIKLAQMQELRAEIEAFICGSPIDTEGGEGDEE